MRKFLGMVAVLALGSCATMQDALESKSQGTAVVYPVSGDVAWEVARRVFRWHGAESLEEDPASGAILAVYGHTFETWGSFSAAWIEPAGDSSTRVTVRFVTRAQIEGESLRSRSWHARFAQAVEIVERGEELPLVAPELPKRERHREAWN